MRSNVFKLSAIAVTVCASFGAQAALYNVYSYLPVVDGEAKTFGVAIQPSAEKCWTDVDCSTTHASGHKIAFEEQLYNQGFSYRDESPFRTAFGFDYLEDKFDGFDRYCNNYLGYTDEACTRWADEQYTRGYAKENPNNNNSYAYIESETTPINDGENNVIVNSFGNDPQKDALGSYYGDSLQKRSIAYKGSAPLSNSSSSTTYDQTKVWAEFNNIQIGSVSLRVSNTSEYRSNAALWNAGSLVVIPNQTDSVDDIFVPQGSLRSITCVGDKTSPDCSSGKLVAVGYSSINNKERTPVASLYDLSSPSSPVVSYVDAFSDNDYLSSLFTDVNNNGVAIGESKSSIPERAYPNSLFYVSDITQGAPTPIRFPGSIFFTGANGKAGAINNFNEVVGQIDYERISEIDGTERAKRAFVTTIGSMSTSPLAGQTRYLDDLTSGEGALTTNNQYRIIDATDINDAGVISGTALFCENGYDTEAIDSPCQGGAPGVEKLVAVKLVPIQGAKPADIQPRPVTETTIERQGASLGWLALGLLTLLGFRRKQ